jgi:hypothetical protein
VKYLEKEGECYVLARSKSRMAKERAIRNPTFSLNGVKGGLW